MFRPLLAIIGTFKYKDIRKKGKLITSDDGQKRPKHILFNHSK